MAESPPRVSVVAPVYNEAESLARLVDEICSALRPLGLPFEIVLADDHSDDTTPLVLRSLARSTPELRVLRLGARGGQSVALAAALRAARGAQIVTLDADLQNDPRDIPRLLRELDRFDVVSGVRALRHDSWLRRAASRVANAVRRMVLGDPFSDIGCSLKAYRAETLRDLPVFDGMHRFLPVLAQLRGARATELPVVHRARLFGRSKYGAIRGRAWRGLWDLVGVRWLRARYRALPEVEEAAGGDEDSARGQGGVVSNT